MPAHHALVLIRLRRSVPTLLCASSLILVAAACSSDSSEYTKAQITVVGEPGSQEVVDNGQPGPSRGDLYSFMQQLVDESGKPAGRIEGFSVITDQGSPSGQDVEYRAATVQFTLDKGTIVVHGVYLVKPRESVPVAEGVRRPIVGGTGAYRHARGEVFQTPLPGGRFKNVIDVETPS